MSQGNVLGVESASLAMDTEEGVEVVWNEVLFPDKKVFKSQEVPSHSYDPGGQVGGTDGGGLTSSRKGLGFSLPVGVLQQEDLKASLLLSASEWVNVNCFGACLN